LPDLLIGATVFFIYGLGFAEPTLSGLAADLNLKIRMLFELLGL